MKGWLRFRKMGGCRSPLAHLIVGSLDGRVATACGLGFDVEAAVDPDLDLKLCRACQRRQERTTYLIPSGEALHKLLRPGQGHLFSEAELTRARMRRATR